VVSNREEVDQNNVVSNREEVDQNNVVSELGECKWAWPDFDDELFEGAREKIKLTRREKRMNRRERLSQVEVGAQQMAKMQREDET
jgi:hypothetical protein